MLGLKENFKKKKENTLVKIKFKKKKKKKVISNFAYQNKL